MSDTDTIVVTLTTEDFKLLMGEHEILKMRTEALVEAAREMLEFYDELIAEPNAKHTAGVAQVSDTESGRTRTASTLTPTSEPVVLPVSLRDYFAAQVLGHYYPTSVGSRMADVAGHCYAMADAMLVERDK